MRIGRLRDTMRKILNEESFFRNGSSRAISFLPFETSRKGRNSSDEYLQKIKLNKPRWWTCILWNAAIRNALVQQSVLDQTVPLTVGRGVASGSRCVLLSAAFSPLIFFLLPQTRQWFLFSPSPLPPIVLWITAGQKWWKHFIQNWAWPPIKTVDSVPFLFYQGALTAVVWCPFVPKMRKETIWWISDFI